MLLATDFMRPVICFRRVSSPSNNERSPFASAGRREIKEGAEEKRADSRGREEILATVAREISGQEIGRIYIEVKSLRALVCNFKTSCSPRNV